MGNVPSCVAEEGPAAFIPSAHMASPFLEQVSQGRGGKAIRRGIKTTILTPKAALFGAYLQVGALHREVVVYLEVVHN